MKKRLLMISGDRSLARGDRSAFYSTLSELRQYFDRIDIITPKSSQHNQTQIFDNVFVYPSPTTLFFQTFWIFFKGFVLNRKYRYSAMTVHEYPPFYNGIGAMLLHIFTKLPYLLEIHHIPGFPKSANLKESIYLFMMKWFMGLDSFSAKKIRVVNKNETPDFLRKAGVSTAKILYCPSFYIDYSVFKPRNDVAKDYDFVYAARLEANKGILNLINAIEILKIKRPNVKLLIIGKGSLSKFLHDEVVRKKLQDNVIFSGWLPTLADVAKAYCSARIFINPSLNEGGPRVLLEAMACGLPVITTRVGISNDIIHEGVNGWFTGWESAEVALKMDSALVSNIVVQSYQNEAFEYRSAIKNYAEAILDIAK